MSCFSEFSIQIPPKSVHMAPTKVILLACGSFNPITVMHLRMFEIARDHLHRLGNFSVVGGLISPVHDSYGKNDLEPATHRLAMVRMALQSTDWVNVSEWEMQQEAWSRTRHVLEYHQNKINALLHRNNRTVECDKSDEVDDWISDNVKNTDGHVQVKLLCGADLLESFGTPGLWKDEDIETIVGRHGLVVITRSNTNPLEFIYNSDLLTKYMSNIIIVTEWIRNEISSTKIRRALKRSESVKYLLPEKVIDYIHKFNLYGTKNTKYIQNPEPNSNYLTPSPNDISMESPTRPCLLICNSGIFPRTIDQPDRTVKSVVRKTLPGQAVKVVDDGKRKSKEVKGLQSMRNLSKSCEDLKKRSQLKECKSCEENLIRFIFTKHGIQAGIKRPACLL